jgi:hypothetical protein
VQVRAHVRAEPCIAEPFVQPVHVLPSPSWCFESMWLMDVCARDGARFIAASLLSLATMVRLEMPQVNVISKVDLVEKIGGLRTCQCALYIYILYLGIPCDLVKLME